VRLRSKRNEVSKIETAWQKPKLKKKKERRWLKNSLKRRIDERVILWPMRKIDGTLIP
jgi:hypothetical protein